MSDFNGIDYFLISIFLFSMLAGFSRGLIKEVISLASLVVAFIVATMFCNQLAASFTSSPAVQGVVSQASSAIGANAATPVSYAAIGVSFGILFAVTLIIGSVVGMVLNMFFTIGMLGLMNRLCGGVFGLARGFLINLVLIFMVQLTAVGSQPAWLQSAIVREYQPTVTWLNGIVAPGFEQLKAKAGTSIQDLSGKVESLVR